MEEKKLDLNKIFVIALAVLTIGAFCTIFAPALKLSYLSDLTGEVVETGTVGSLFAIMLRLKLSYTYDGSIYYNRMKSGKNIPALMLFMVMIVLIILAITMLVLVFMGKFKGKTKMILSVTFALLLLATIVFSLLEPTILKVTPLPDEILEQGVYSTKQTRSLGLAPILYTVVGTLAFGANIGNILTGNDEIDD